MSNRRLSEIPPELEELFEFILRRIPSRYASQAYRFLRIMHRWHTQSSGTNHLMTAVMFSFAEDTGNDPVTALAARPFTESEMRQLLEDLDARLKSRCLGLLEIQNSLREPSDYQDEPTYVYAVHFLHKSVLDYLDATPQWQEILCAELPNFDVGFAILKGLLASLKTACIPDAMTRFSSESLYLLEVLVDAMRFNRFVETSTGHAQSEILESIDATMCTAFSSRTGLDSHWSDWVGDEEDNHSRKAWNSTFLSLAIRCGATLYVKQQLTQCRGRLPVKEGRPLLDYAVHPVPMYSDLVFGANPEIAKMLLEHGANPNEKFNGYTIWSNVLYDLRHRFFILRRRRPPSRTVSTPKYHFEVLRTIRILLEFGADPSATCFDKVRPVGGTKMYTYDEFSAPDVLSGWLKEQCPCLREDQAISDCRCDVAVKLRARVDDLLRMVKGKKPKLSTADSDEGEDAGDGFKDQAVRASATFQTRRRRIGQWFAQALRKASPVE